MGVQLKCCPRGLNGLMTEFRSLTDGQCHLESGLLVSFHVSGKGILLPRLQGDP